MGERLVKFEECLIKFGKLSQTFVHICPVKFFVVLEQT